MLKDFLNHLVNIFYPKICVVCRLALSNGAVDNLVCRQCWSKIERNLPPICAICGRQIRNKQITKRVCLNCQRRIFHFDRALAPYIYEGVLKELIHKFKYEGKDYLGKTLSSLWKDFIRQYQQTLCFFDLIIPIPLHKTKLREREFNQAEFFGKQISAQLGLNLSLGNFIRIRQTQTQTKLPENQRWDNVRGCFELRQPSEICGKNIILVDDVLTTGATCSEAASVLKSAGAGCIFVITLAN